MYKYLPRDLHPALQLPFSPLTYLEMHVSCISTSPLWNVTFSYLLLLTFCWDICSLSYEHDQLFLLLQDSAEVLCGLRSNPELDLFPVSSWPQPLLGDHISLCMHCSIMDRVHRKYPVIRVRKRHCLPHAITINFSPISVTTSHLARRKQSGKAC